MSKTARGMTLNRLQAASRLTRTALAARLIAHGFYAGQDQVMIVLSQEDGITPGVLSNRLGVRPPTVTKTVARLQAQGMVEKLASASDQRQANIHLTEKGGEAIKAIEKALRKTEKQALKGLDKKEQKQLAKLLARVEANLTDIEFVEEPEDASEAEETEPA
ncbi:MarR family transcriptional regulator [Chelativorans sp. ZYF759]|uniref:MarR family winged helix-turn-helix transcriptional regulator n=1 Tax=Chelativorans sp. ZYF759 TaxID=2692213 RepID=UPI00145F1507|nr:MarR family transcriptional regulator [Chelativorans sp. ZYF759]NMG39216.1 MarR family transcriptional regulator [Chelativorans sp. ZYF759]